MIMDQQEFLRKLSEVAEWKIPENEQETSANAKKKRGRKSDEELYQEAHEEIFNEIHGGVNPTKSPLLLKVKYKKETCEHCGNDCPNGRHVQTKLIEGKEKKAWRSYCSACDKYSNPYTGEFDLTKRNYSIVWIDWARKSNPKESIPESQITITNYQEKN